jgi:uncharacterized delta-60 repeat protein
VAHPKLRVEALEDRTVPAYGFDPTFADIGKISTWNDRVTYTPDVEVQADGGILVTASPTDVSRGRYERGELIRYNPDGTRDLTFGGGERALYDQEIFGTRITLAPDGDIYLAANLNDLGFSERDRGISVYRFNADGTRDAAFGDDGRVVFEFDPADELSTSYMSELVVQADGKLVVVGRLTGDHTASVGYSLARLNTDGSLDATFGGDGIVSAPAASADTRISDVAVTDDGKLVVVATTEVWPEMRASVVRFNADGTLDDSFAANGVWVGRTGTQATEVFALADGRVLAVGIADADASAVRLNADGTVDTTFGTGDWTAIGQVGKYGSVSAERLPDGRLVVVTSNVDIFTTAVVRMMSPDGEVLPAFVGGDAFGVQYDGPVADSVGFPSYTRVAVGADGRIVVVGGVYEGTSGVLRDNALAVAVLADDPAALPGGPTTSPPVPPPSITGQPVPPFVPITMPEPPPYIAPQPPPDDSHLLPPPWTVQSSAIVLAEEGRVALADVNGDGVRDTINVSGPGKLVRVWVVSGSDPTVLLVPEFAPFGGDFAGGGFVAAADLDGDGRAEFVVTPDQGGGPRVVVFSYADVIPAVVGASHAQFRQNFFGLDDASFRGGARVALGDVNGDGTPDLAVSAGFLGGPRVVIFDGRSVFTTPTRLVSDFFAFPGDDVVTLRNGAVVALGDVDGDGKAELIAGGGPGGAPRIVILSGAKLTAGDIAGAQANPLANFFVAGNTTARDGVRVTAEDTDSDGRADVVVSNGEAKLRRYLGKHFGGGGEPTQFEDIDLTVALSGTFVG